MSANTPLPQLTWASATLVNIAAAPGCPATVRLTQQDGVQRTFSGTLSFDPSLGAVNGGLDTGVEAISTWYYLYLVASGPALVVRGSVTPPTTTGPTGYTNWTYVGAVRNDASGNLLAFVHSKNRFDYAYGPQFTFEGAPTMGSLVTQALADYVPLTCSHVYFNLSGWPYNYSMNVAYVATASATGWQLHRSGMPGGSLGGNVNFVPGAPTPTPATPKVIAWWITLTGGNYQNQTRHVHGWTDGWRR